MKLAVSQTLICTTADDILLFLRKKVIMIRKLSISRSTYLLKRRVSFLLITTGYIYTSHVFFFTTECCDFGERQPWYISYKNALFSKDMANNAIFILVPIIYNPILNIKAVMSMKRNTNY
jgi:hypothetical protein